MQPYYYPYIGYFELIKSVDKFVFLNNVQYIRRGWVNRNRIRWNNTWKYLTVPIVKCSRSTLIENIKISGDEWKRDHLISIIYSYNNVINHPIVQHLASLTTNSLCELLMDTLQHTAQFLGLKTEFLDSRNYPSDRRKQYLLIDICKQLGATTYVNAPGGVSLYDPADFEQEKIKLEFLPPTKHENKFSILDLLLYDGIKLL